MRCIALLLVMAFLICFVIPLWELFFNQTEERSCYFQNENLGSFIQVPVGAFVKGAYGFYPEEGPPVKIRVAPFLIQINEVTNDQFAQFVKETGHVTEAESNGGSASFVQSDTPEQWLWVALW